MTRCPWKEAHQPWAQKLLQLISFSFASMSQLQWQHEEFHLGKGAYGCRDNPSDILGGDWKEISVTLICCS